ncbi:MAG TPA: histidine phosphatase family protein [Oscillospiraceae bacterium]|nr:histidine phosphatase family protein [Oscillospiraceae bacterium]HPK35123.1 histidine phosphatase family protein [Oscillospiraceae bacterium]HPR74926.1 histidine phosphatase family protein [Oscillospiraceae bacterium]
MKNIITIQHTQSAQHTNGMIGSWADWDLTELGVEQAKRIGERLFEELKNERYLLYSSDLKRAKHTADIVAGYFGVEPILTPALREFNLGEAVGKSKEWARANLKCSIWPGTVDWPKNIDDIPFAEAESKRDVWNRLSGFYQQIMASPEQNFILVSHDGTLSIFFALWLGLDITMLNQCNLSGKSGGVSFLHEDINKRHIISRLNDLSYFK